MLYADLYSDTYLDTYGVPAGSYTLLTPPGLFSPMAFRRQAWPSQALPLIAGADTGTAAEAASVTAEAGLPLPGQLGGTAASANAYGGTAAGNTYGGSAM